MRRHTGVWAALLSAVAALTLAVPAAADPTPGGAVTPPASVTPTPTPTPSTTAPTPPPSATPTSPSATPSGSATPRSKGVPAGFLGQLEDLRTQATTLTTTLTAAQATATTAIASYTATTQAVQAALATAQQAQQDLVGAQAEVAEARKRVQVVARDAYVERIPRASTALLLTSNVEDVDFTVAALGYLSSRGDDEYDRLETARERATTLSNQQTTALANAQKLQATADTQRATALTALGQVQAQQGAFLAAVTTLRDAAAKAAAATALSPADTAAYQTFLAELNALGAGGVAGVPGGTTYVTGGPGLTPLPGTAWVKPLTSYTISSCYCARWGTFHHGVDLAAPSGTPIYAVGAGTVVAAGPANGFGNWVVIDHHDGSFSVYGHMRVLATVVGAQVAPGALIAYVGDEGESSGFHLHFEVRIGSYASAANSTDPTLWLAQRGVSL